MQFTYDAADRRTTLTLPNGVSTQYGYDTASRLTALTYKLGATTLGDLQYTYDPGGNRIGLQHDRHPHLDAEVTRADDVHSGRKQPAWLEEVHDPLPQVGVGRRLFILARGDDDEAHVTGSVDGVGEYVLRLEVAARQAVGAGHT